MERRLGFSLTVVAFLIASALPAWAQDEAELPNSWLMPLSRPPTLSDDADWVIMIHETGGFAGVDQRATIDSTGAISCVGFPTPCSDEIPTESLSLLDRQIRDASPDGWSGSLASGSDLLTHEVVLVLKGFGSHTAYWNLAPADASASAAILHQMVRGLLFPD